MKEAHLFTLVCGYPNGSYVSHITIAVEDAETSYAEDNKFYFKCGHYSIIPEGSADNYKEYFICSEISIIVPEGYIVGKPANPMQLSF